MEALANRKSLYQKMDVQFAGQLVHVLTRASLALLFSLAESFIKLHDVYGL